MRVIDLIVKVWPEKSLSDARRLIRQNGFKIEDQLITDESATVLFFSEEVKWLIEEKHRILEIEKDGSIFETLK